MSIITGLADEALADFADDFEDGAVIVPGGRVSDGQGGWIDANPVTHPCKVLLTDYSDYRRVSLGVPATDRLVLVLGASLGIIPAKGHKVIAPDPAKGLAPATFDVIAKTGDPGSALYKLQAR